MSLNQPKYSLTRRKFLRNMGLAASGLAWMPYALSGRGSNFLPDEAYLLVNPTPHTYLGEPVRLKIPYHDSSGSFLIKQDGIEIPYQVEEMDGQKWIWVSGDLPPGAQRKYELVPGQPQSFPKKVNITEEDNFYIVGNGKVTLKIPAAYSSGIPGPIAGIRLNDGTWVGRSFWVSSCQLLRYSAQVIGDGTVMAKLRLRYDFIGKAGAHGELPAFSEIDLMLAPEWDHAVIFERHEMGPDDHWVLEMSHGWSPGKGISRQFNNGPGGDTTFVVPPMDRDLVPVQNVSFAPGLYINLIPRWNQHFKDGWAFAASDGNRQLSAVVVKASRWKWPHDNNLQCLVRPEGNYAGIRCSTRHGQRLWWLSPSLSPMETSYIGQFAWENPDKINHDYILSWPGKNTLWWNINPYNSEQTNPTHTIRRIGKEAMKRAGEPPEADTLIRFQTLIHNDCWASYWDYFSPENPNFFTDYNLVPIALATNLKEHPQFARFRRLAENKFREDLYHSITLPGGAGQECPGYSHYGMSLWREIVEMGEKHLGFDMKFINERLEASEKFYERISFPDGEIRRGSPMGDSHPDVGGKTGMHRVEVDPDWVKSWKTEEFPGFGVLFTNRPGTDRETYLSFKSGPNRCHYHGDQLAYHYCANGRPLVVDHHCSYRPRAGQEHMHNRLAFFTNEMPFANMDGYERVLALKTSPEVDIAIGQVESNRLRKVEPLPPEVWDARYPQLQFDEPLIYRRTVVLVKNGDQDYFVFRDQYWADRPINAAYCLHTYGEMPIRKGQMIDFGKLVIFCTHADFSMKNLDWSHERGGYEETKGIRLEISGQSGEMITVMYPGNTPPHIKELPGGVQVGRDRVVFMGKKPESGPEKEVVAVYRSGKKEMVLFGKEMDEERSQGEIGLFVPDAGYPFGEIPDWLIRQRDKKPGWKI